jgi:hypothetical protein
MLRRFGFFFELNLQLSTYGLERQLNKPAKIRRPDPKVVGGAESVARVKPIFYYL